MNEDVILAVRDRHTVENVFEIACIGYLYNYYINNMVDNILIEWNEHGKYTWINCDGDRISQQTTQHANQGSSISKNWRSSAGASWSQMRLIATISEMPETDKAIKQSAKPDNHQLAKVIGSGARCFQYIDCEWSRYSTAESYFDSGFSNTICVLSRGLPYWIHWKNGIVRWIICSYIGREQVYKLCCWVCIPW